MLIQAGKMMMDCHAPDTILDSAQSSYDDSKALIECWHKRGRCMYTVTPRFALTSSSEQLEMAGALMREYSDVRLAITYFREPGGSRAGARFVSRAQKATPISMNITACWMSGRYTDTGSTCLKMNCVAFTRPAPESPIVRHRTFSLAAACLISRALKLRHGRSRSVWARMSAAAPVFPCFRP